MAQKMSTRMSRTMSQQSVRTAPWDLLEINKNGPPRGGNLWGSGPGDTLRELPDPDLRRSSIPPSVVRARQRRALPLAA
jgi:hypothetical protein